MNTSIAPIEATSNTQSAPAFERPATAAVLRVKARDEQAKLNWGYAATLFDMAADKIPGNGALNEADRANLRAHAKSCRTMQVRELYPNGAA